jgi:hypothetical protein
MEYFRVTDHKNLLRDKNSKAIITNDSETLNKYKEDRALRLKLASIAQDYDGLKSEVGEIKDMLRTLLERNSK